MIPGLIIGCFKYPVIAPGQGYTPVSGDNNINKFPLP